MLTADRTTPPLIGYYARRFYGGRRRRRLLDYLHEDGGRFVRTLKGGEFMGKWISKRRRLALYLRDGLACVWCGVGIEDGAQLSLDHLRCRCAGGGHECSNLVTSCTLCNNRRGERSLEEFAAAVAGYLDVSPSHIIDHIEHTRRHPVDIDAAGKLIERRGSVAAALDDAVGARLGEAPPPAATAPGKVQT